MFTLSDPNADGCENNESAEVPVQFVVARGEATELFEASEQVLNQMTCAVAVLIERTRIR